MLRLNMADLGLGEKLKSLYRGGRDYERFRLLALQMGELPQVTDGGIPQIIPEGLLQVRQDQQR